MAPIFRGTAGISERARYHQELRTIDRVRFVVRQALSHLLVVAVYASLAAIAPAHAQPTGSAPAAHLPEGVWTVQGREIPGTRRCGHWMVRLTNAQGRLSGVISLARGSVPIQNLTLQPDGSFSGTTQAGVVGTTHARAYTVTGRFSGDMVNLTLENNACPARHGAATRQAGRG
jgi:hypothetical protein